MYVYDRYKSTMLRKVLVSSVRTCSFKALVTVHSSNAFSLFSFSFRFLSFISCNTELLRTSSLSYNIVQWYIKYGYHTQELIYIERDTYIMTTNITIYIM